MVAVRPIFTEAEMDQIGAELAILRPDTCTISRPTSGKDSAGAPVSGPFVYVVTAPCRVDASGLQGAERVTGPRYISEGRFSVALPRHTDVRNDDRIEVFNQLYVAGDPDPTPGTGTSLDVVYASQLPSFHFEITVQCTHSG